MRTLVLGTSIGFASFCSLVSISRVARADVAPPPEYVDSCAAAGKGGGRECIECVLPDVKEPGCDQRARAEGFTRECSGWGYTKYCRKAQCAAASMPSERKDCVLVDLKWPRHLQATLPLHEEVCRSYRDELFATNKLFARRVLCLKSDASPVDAGIDPSIGCVKFSRIDCEQRCLQGNAISCQTLGEMYKQGQGVLPDDRKSAEFLERACLAGRAPACLSASELFAKGSPPNAGTPDRLVPDAAKATLLARKACDANLDAGCANLPAVGSVSPLASSPPPPSPAPTLADAAPDVSVPPLDNRPPAAAPSGCGRCGLSTHASAANSSLWGLIVAALIGMCWRARRTR